MKCVPGVDSGFLFAHVQLYSVFFSLKCHQTTGREKRKRGASSSTPSTTYQQ